MFNHKVNMPRLAISVKYIKWILLNNKVSISISLSLPPKILTKQRWSPRVLASTTRVLILPNMINMNMGQVTDVWLSCYLVLLSVDNKTGGRLNIKMPSYQHRDSHVKDKTVSPTVLSLTWESPYLGKTVFILRQGPGNKTATPLWPDPYSKNFVLECYSSTNFPVLVVLCLVLAPTLDEDISGTAITRI